MFILLFVHMAEPPNEEKLVAIRGLVPESLRNSFKAACAEEGKTMSEVVIEFVEGYVGDRRGKARKT